jgi:hypothetical protein
MPSFACAQQAHIGTARDQFINQHHWPTGSGRRDRYLYHSFYKPHLPRNHTEKHGQDHKLHVGTTITRKMVNGRSRNVLCFSVFRVFPWLK